MYGFIVNADAADTGELINERRRGSRLMLAHNARANFIQLGSRRARPNRLLRSLKHFANNSASSTEPGKLFWSIYGQEFLRY